MSCSKARQWLRMVEVIRAFFVRVADREEHLQTLSRKEAAAFFADFQGLIK